MREHDEFGTLAELRHGDLRARFFDVNRLPGAAGLPRSLKVMLENVVRTFDANDASQADVASLAGWTPQAEPYEIPFFPGRVLMPDLSGIPSLIDLAAMRETLASRGADARLVNPRLPIDFVIDHSIVVDHFGSPQAASVNARLDFERNRERYDFLDWAASAFDRLRLAPRNSGICHQLNLERLASVVALGPDGIAVPDSVVGTDSHTPMINALGVLGWGVGGIEAEAALLGEPLSLVVPPVVGVEVVGELPPGSTSTDLALTMAQVLRRHGVVGAFVEFYGAGLAGLPVATRATLSNMSPEYGSTCSYFPIDDATLGYLRLTGRPAAGIRLVEAYAKEQGLWADPHAVPRFSARITLDLSAVEPSVAGPSRPQDRLALPDLPSAVRRFAERRAAERRSRATAPEPAAGPSAGQEAGLMDGAIAIAAITSCTNTSNSEVMIAAGLLARAANARGMRCPAWVKTSLAPGSTAVVRYLERAGLLRDLQDLGFWVVGFGCTTCMGNSGELVDVAEGARREHDVALAAVLSGNRNFEGRIHPDVSMNFLASPPLVVAYALAGRADIDLTAEPLGLDAAGEPVMLRDVWPSSEEIARVQDAVVTSAVFTTAAPDPARPPGGPAAGGLLFDWADSSTYIKRSPFLDDLAPSPAEPADIEGARVLTLLGDSVTTDHISPVSAIRPDSEAGRYLTGLGVPPGQLSSLGARRGNHEVMVRSIFTNRRLVNRLVPGEPGGVTRCFANGRVMSVYEAAQAYAARAVPLIVVAGRDYGTGSSRDWAAKGTAMLGVRAVIAEGFERIHRSNLVGMGILPLQFLDGESADTLGLTGAETFAIRGLSGGRERLPKKLTVTADDRQFSCLVRLDTPTEERYYRHGGILRYVARDLLASTPR